LVLHFDCSYVRTQRPRSWKKMSSSVDTARNNAKFYGKLRGYFAFKYRAVKDKEGKPTTQQLVQYISTMKTQIDQVLDNHRPAKVVDPIAKSFKTIGWNWGKNVPEGKVPPNRETLIGMLNTNCTTFHGFVMQERAKLAAAIEPTQHDLESLDNGVDKLWELDAKSRMRPDVDYYLDMQGGKKPYAKGDRASRPLFKFVSEDALASRPTFKAFMALLDNYERAVGVAETVTYTEKKEIQTFLSECLKTPLMKYAHKWLVSKKLSDPDPKKFLRQLQKMWFGMYKRDHDSKGPDSSGFEHVFVGEERNGAIIGCHNWLQIYLQEKLGNLNYLGYIYPKRRGHHNKLDSHEHIMTIQFEWRDGKKDNSFELKPVSTSWVGTSPEFELALYTMTFLAGKKENVMDVGPYMVNIKCYTIRRGHAKHLSTSFPEEHPFTKDEHSFRQF